MCGTAFMGTGGAWYCDDACKVVGQRTAKARRRRREKDTRRARGRDAFIEPVYRTKVFERDGWRCGLCGQSVPKGLAVPHPKAATLDHIVPIAAGGTHGYANVQLAHFLCNSRKSDRVAGPGEQLRLIS